VKRRRWIVVVAAAAAMVTARLGMWQLDRAEQKRQWQAALDSRSALPVLDGEALARSAGDAAAQHHRRIRLRGRWLEQHTVYLDNRQMHGRPGFYVVTPLELGAGDAVLVQRGWMPRDPADRTRLQPPPAAPGEVTVFGRVAPPPGRLLELGEAAGGTIRQNLDIAAYARETGRPLRPLSIVQLEGPEAPADGLQRAWPVPTADIGRHRGYALTWFSLCALIVASFVWFQLIRPRHVRTE
jgi:surfeit locus 1 family protein